jgi:hypothetical protein
VNYSGFMNSAVLPQNAVENTANESPSLKLTRELVLAHGWNSTSFQIINPGIKRWFSEAKDSVVGFVSCNGVRVTAGAMPPHTMKKSATFALKRGSNQFIRIRRITQKSFSERSRSGIRQTGLRLSPRINHYGRN